MKRILLVVLVLSISAPVMADDADWPVIWKGMAYGEKLIFCQGIYAALICVTMAAEPDGSTSWDRALTVRAQAEALGTSGILSYIENYYSNPKNPSINPVLALLFLLREQDLAAKK